MLFNLFKTHTHIGSLASSVFDPFTALVGASGGVYALITAQLANVILVSVNICI